MPDQIHQMQISFVADQDRLLFRFNTTAQDEFRFWLTRRYVKLLWPVLLSLLEKTPGLAQTQADRQAKAAVLSFQHEQVVRQADFATPYQQSQAGRRPLGEEPVLLGRIQVKAGTSPLQSVLCLHPERGAGIDLNLDARLLHLLCQLLAAGVKQADWDLNYELTDLSPTPVTPRHRIN